MKHGHGKKRIEYTRHKEIDDQLNRPDMKHREIG